LLFTDPQPDGSWKVLAKPAKRLRVGTKIVVENRPDVTLVVTDIVDDGSRIVGRLSGTGTEGATLRLYFERCRKRGDEDLEKVLQPLVEAAHNIFHLKDRFNRDQPSVIT